MTHVTASSSTPLAGIRVLDLGRYQAGPRCALMLARMGAEVIKIEALTGDESRDGSPMVRGQSAYWVQYNSGKKSLAMDLRSDKGKSILEELVKVSDILIQNFRPGTIDAMGFGYEALRNLNAGIIMVNASAYGQYGPYRDRVGFDHIGQAMGGLMSLTGAPGGPPTLTSFPLIDRITSLHATIGALAALRERSISGQGQSIDVCLADTGFTTNEIPISGYLSAGLVQEREGNGAGLTNAYQSTDGWVYIVAANDAMWERVCKALGKPEWLSDSRLTTRAGRTEHTVEIEGELARWFAARTSKEAVEYLSGFSIPCAPVNTVEQAAQEPHLHQREIMVPVPDALAGTIYVTGKMIKFSRTPMVVGSAPTVGEHTKEILTSILSYSEEQLQRLQREGVIGLGLGPAAKEEETASRSRK